MDSLSDRILPFRASAIGDTNMTIEKCKKLCFSDHDYLFAGVEYSNQCWCGNDRPHYKTYAPQSECNYLCNGNQDQKCGGKLRISIFQNGGNILFI